MGADIDLSGDPLLAQISGCISCAGAIVLAFSFLVCPKWRQRLFSLRSLIFCLSVSILLEMQNFIYHTNARNNVCQYQAVTMQFFWIMSWFYEGFIAIESMVVVSSMVAATKRGYGEFSGFVGLRFVFYHIFTVLGAASTSLYVLIEGDFTLLESWCWIRTPAMRIYIGYLPIWIVMAIILICDIYIFWTVYNSIEQVKLETMKRSPSQQDSSPTRIKAERSSSTATATGGGVFAHRVMIMRFTLGPLLMVLLHVPGSLLRFSQISHSHINLTDGEMTFWATAQAFCDPLHGAISAIVWVFTDKAVCEEWICFLCGRTREVESKRGDAQNSPSHFNTAWKDEDAVEGAGDSRGQLRWSMKHVEEDGSGRHLADTDGTTGDDSERESGIHLSTRSGPFGSSYDDRNEVGLSVESSMYKRYSDQEYSNTPGVYSNPLLFTSDSSKHLSFKINMRESEDPSED